MAIESSRSTLVHGAMGWACFRARAVSGAAASLAVLLVACGGGGGGHGGPPPGDGGTDTSTGADGGTDAGGGLAGALAGFYRVDAVTFGADTHVRGEGVGVVGDILVEATGDASARFRVRLGLLRDGLLVEAPVVDGFPFLVEEDRWVVDLGGDTASTQVFAATVEGDTLTLVRDTTDPRDDAGPDGPAALTLVRATAPDTAWAGSYSLVSQTDGDMSVALGECHPGPSSDFEISSVSFTATDRLVLALDFVHDRYADDGCTTATFTDESHLDGLAEQDGDEWDFWFFDADGADDLYLRMRVTHDATSLTFDLVDCLPAGECPTSGQMVFAPAG